MNMITIPAIIKAVQELQRQVEVLSKEVESLKVPEAKEEPVEIPRRGRPRKE